MEPRFIKKVPRHLGNLFVISRVRYVEHLHFFNFPENYQNVHYIEVNFTFTLGDCVLHNVHFLKSRFCSMHTL